MSSERAGVFVPLFKPYWVRPSSTIKTPPHGLKTRWKNYPLANSRIDELLPLDPAFLETVKHK
ncbi:MAG: hypothetical protein NTV43_00920 [Methylococcales bacterium]|nr:hypothetical protein [Methylococcales bacterium]